MQYVERYGARLNFNHNMVAVDGPARKAWFKVPDSAGQSTTVEREFDLLHMVPSQHAPDFIRHSALATADRQSTRLNSSHQCAPRMPSSACKNTIEQNTHT